jgi:hypothetical protein
MAVSLISGPQKYQPVFNPIVFSFYSTDYAACQFNYIMDVYVNGEFVIRLKADPEPSDSSPIASIGVFRIDEVLRNYVSSTFNPNLVGFSDNPNGILYYYVEIRERYNTTTNCIGIPTIGAVAYTSGTFFAWNGALQYDEFINYNQDTYQMTYGLGKFLTSVPNGSMISTDDNFVVNFLQDYGASPSVTVGALVVRTYDVNHTLIDEYQTLNQYANPATTGQLYLSVGVGPQQLNQTAWEGSPTPTTPITDSVCFYDIRLVDSIALSYDLSETIEFEINRKCTKFTPQRLWWLSPLGGFDSYTFMQKTDRSVSIGRNSYNRFLQPDYAAGDRGETVINVDAQELLTFNSQILNEAEAAWMETLFTSPEVYLAQEQDPVTYTVEAETCTIVYTTDFTLTGDPVIPTGTFFTYSITDGSAIGIPNSGSGLVTGHSTGFVETNIPCTTLISGISTGTLTYTPTFLQPLVVTASAFESKYRTGSGNITYEVPVRLAYKKNIQKQ